MHELTQLRRSTAVGLECGRPAPAVALVRQLAQGLCVLHAPLELRACGELAQALRLLRAVAGAVGRRVLGILRERAQETQHVLVQVNAVALARVFKVE